MCLRMSPKQMFLAVTLCITTFGALAQDDTFDNRQAGVDRYLKAVPMKTLLDDTFVELAKQLPQDKRAAFIDQMKAAVRADALERIARDAMVKIFTADELNALADFYGSKDGASAMKKFGVYSAQIMPAIRQEIQNAVLQNQNQKK